MEVERASAGRMIDRLEANGWVERRAQDGDRRVKRVYLTPEAERVHRRIWRVAEATVDDALADLSAREGAQLRALLGRVKKNLIAVVGRRCERRRLRAARRRAARIATTGAWRREELPHIGAVRRAGAGAGRRADVLAAGRPLRRDRERLRQGRHRADRERGRRPHRRGARARPCHSRGRRRAGAARSRALSARARQGRSRNRFRAFRCRAAQGEPARDARRREGNREPPRLSRGAGEAPARAVRPRRQLGGAGRAGRQRGAAGARPPLDAAAAHRARRSRARRQSRAADRPLRRRAREAGAARPRRARSLVYGDQGAARRHRAQCPASVGRAGEGADAAVLIGRRPAAVGRGEFQGDRPHLCDGRPEGDHRARHASRHHLGGRGRKHQPGDRRRVRDPAAAERERKLGEGGAAPAGEAAADRAAGRAAAARRHDGLCQHRHEALALLAKIFGSGDAAAAKP